MRHVLLIGLVAAFLLACGGETVESTTPEPPPPPAVTTVGVEFAPPGFVSYSSELGYVYAIFPEATDFYEWSLEKGPPGMSIDSGPGASPATAIVRWNAACSTAATPVRSKRYMAATV